MDATSVDDATQLNESNKSFVPKPTCKRSELGWTLDRSICWETLEDSYFCSLKHTATKISSLESDANAYQFILTLAVTSFIWVFPEVGQVIGKSGTIRLY